MTERALWERRSFWRAIGFQPTEAQLDPLCSNATIRAFTAGRRTGKTLCWGVEDARVLASGPYRVLVIAPSHELTERVWRVVSRLTWASKNPADRRTWEREAKNDAPGIRRARFPWGAELVGMSSSDPDKSALGDSYDLIHVTEAARIRRVVYEDYVLPMIMDSAGALILDTTPRGDNWYRGVHEDGRAGRNGTESWRLPTWVNTAKFPGGEHDPKILAYKARVSKESFRQEIEASFVTFRGRIVPEFDRENHGYHGQPPWMPTRVFGGVDWGYTHPAALVVGGYDNNGRGIVLEEWVGARTRLAQIIEQAQRMQAQWGVTTWFCGNDEPEHMAEFADHGLDCAGAEDGHRAGADCLGSLMRELVAENGRGTGHHAFAISLDLCPMTARALEVAHYKERRGEFNDDFDDESLDPVDALRYLFLSARSSWDPAGMNLDRLIG